MKVRDSGDYECQVTGFDDDRNTQISDKDLSSSKVLNQKLEINVFEKSSGYAQKSVERSSFLPGSNFNDLNIQNDGKKSSDEFFTENPDFPELRSSTKKNVDDEDDDFKDNSNLSIRVLVNNVFLVSLSVSVFVLQYFRIKV